MKLRWVQECKSCKGTGVYVGIAERDGYGVVCRDCKGTGKTECSIEYNEYKGRQPRKDIKTVLHHNVGICVGDCEFEFGGMSYSDWLNGKQFPKGHEMRNFCCPYWYYGQDKSARCSGCKDVSAGMNFKQCPHYPYKNVCWKEYDSKEEFND
jgi:hypothetical protein